LKAARIDTLKEALNQARRPLSEAHGLWLRYCRDGMEPD